MPFPSFPLVDSENPLYCPSISASAYLRSTRQQQRRKKAAPAGNSRPLRSFVSLLNDALVKEENLPPDLPSFRSSSPSRDSWQPPWDDRTLSHLARKAAPLQPIGNKSRNHVLKRKRSNFADRCGPVKFAKSVDVFDDKSFEVVIKREKLDYPPLDIAQDSSPNLFSYENKLVPANTSIAEIAALRRKINALEDSSKGASEIFEPRTSIANVIDRLDLVMPGIRLKERLRTLEDLTYQGIVDYLGNNGLLNTRVLTLFSKSKVRSVNLRSSLHDEDGLNLNPMIDVFSQPQTFRYLSELVFTSTPVNDFDLVHIQHLPRLSTLLLNNTGIGNEAIFLLVPLKQTLARLSIATNAKIDDDAVPALLLLSKLSFISILDTSIEMVGLRSLAKVIHEEERIVDIEIPTACEFYIDNVHTKYLLDPVPPLITTPEICCSLSINALKRNLEAHHDVNPDIVPTGTKAEMAERLHNILKIREMDVIVRDMMVAD